MTFVTEDWTEKEGKDKGGGIKENGTPPTEDDHFKNSYFFEELQELPVLNPLNTL